LPESGGDGAEQHDVVRAGPLHVTAAVEGARLQAPETPPEVPTAAWLARVHFCAPLPRRRSQVVECRKMRILDVAVTLVAWQPRPIVAQGLKS